MKQINRKRFWMAVGVLAAFILWTAAVCLVDVQAIGPMGSTVGFAALNAFVHRQTGVHMALYVLTDWLSIVPLLFIPGFGLLGLVQWIRRKRLAYVDRSILVLGGFYMVVMAVYVLFELLAINFRPILIHGVLEASYPSSTTMLVLCVIPTAMLQLRERIKHQTVRRCFMGLLAAFLLFMVLARLVSGVHWFTDIVGGTILSTGLVLLYASLA